jgi:pentose-5-phosphate-3-epimerase/putative flippase GtrA
MIVDTQRREILQRRAAAAAAADMPLVLRLRRTATRLAWRYRYLIGFIVIGFASVALEVSLVLLANRYLMPTTWVGAWQQTAVSLVAFVIGMEFAFVMNARFNFHVSAKYFFRTFVLFALISTLSYSLNKYAAQYLEPLHWNNYPASRFVTTGCLFLIAYSLHRRFTFRHARRSLGLAMYTNEIGEIGKLYRKVGEQCDHIHIDLLDETFDPEAVPVDLLTIAVVRDLYRWHPLCLHIMSKRPKHWIEQTAEYCDWVLIHVDIEEDVMDNIALCRERGCKVGVVWHHTITVQQLLPYLPHVDFLAVLGIDRPGRSGQVVLNSALIAAQRFRELSQVYNYELIFDGGVTTENIYRIPASIVVSSSSVLRAQSPIHNALVLMAGGRRDR